MVRPQPSPETIGLQHLMIVEPLELEILSAQKREQDEVTIVDMILEKKSIDYFIKKHKPEVFCITGYITNVSVMIEYCKLAKTLLPQVSTVVGGVHCEVVPEDFESEYIDYRAVRNANVIFTDLLNYIDGNINDLPKGILTKKQKIKDIELPDFDFRTPMADRKAVEKYRDNYFYIFHKAVALIKTSFGCPYSCSFCFCRIITDDKYVQRSINEVIEELKTIKEKEIYIVDDDFLFDKKRIQLFISELKKHNIKKHFLVYGRADFIAKNANLIHDFKQVGLRTVIVGFESFSDKELDLYNKKINVEMYKTTMDVLNKEKIDCFATLIIPPEYDKEDFKFMVKSIKALGIHYVNLQPLTPLPKTGVSYPEDKIILDRKKYELWDLAHISVQPTKLSVPDFYKEILKAYNSILYQPKVLFKYLTSYSPVMLYKMFAGGIKVTKQYKRKIKEAEENA